MACRHGGRFVPAWRAVRKSRRMLSRMVVSGPGSVGAGGWGGGMEGTPTREPQLIAALGAAHAALDTATVPGPDRAPARGGPAQTLSAAEVGRGGGGGRAGGAPAETLSAAELGRAVRLQAGLEGRLAGLRLHTLAAAETTGASQVTGAADTGAWAASAAGRSRPRSWGAAWLG